MEKNNKFPPSGTTTREKFNLAPKMKTKFHRTANTLWYYKEKALSTPMIISKSFKAALKFSVRSSTAPVISNHPPMENPKRQRTTCLAARNLKRKLSPNTDVAPIVTQFIDVDDEHLDLVVAIRRHVEVLNSCFSDPDFDREAVNEAAADIADLAKIGTVLLHLSSNRWLYRTRFTLFAC